MKWKNIIFSFISQRLGEKNTQNATMMETARNWNHSNGQISFFFSSSPDIIILLYIHFFPLVPFAHRMEVARLQINTQNLSLVPVLYFLCFLPLHSSSFFSRVSLAVTFYAHNHSLRVKKGNRRERQSLTHTQRENQLDTRERERECRICV